MPGKQQPRKNLTAAEMAQRLRDQERHEKDRNIHTFNSLVLWAEQKLATDPDGDAAPMVALIETESRRLRDTFTHLGNHHQSHARQVVHDQALQASMTGLITCFNEILGRSKGDPLRNDGGLRANMRRVQTFRKEISNAANSCSTRVQMPDVMRP